jgi:hypothetical protein
MGRGTREGNGVGEKRERDRERGEGEVRERALPSQPTLYTFIISLTYRWLSIIRGLHKQTLERTLPNPILPTLILS